MDDGMPIAYLEYGELIGYNAKNSPEDLNAVLKFRNTLQHFIDVSTATPPEPVEEGTPITTFNTHTLTRFHTGRPRKVQKVADFATGV